MPTPTTPPLPGPERRPPGTVVRPTREHGALDDATTEVIRVIEFLWIGSQGVQPVLMLQRELLH